MEAEQMLQDNIKELDLEIFQLESQIQEAVTVCAEVSLKQKLNQLLTKRGRYADMCKRLNVPVDPLRPLKFYK